MAGPDAPEVIGPVIELAAAALVAGDFAGADAFLQRASRLLDRDPEQDRALRLRVLVLQSERLARTMKLTESNKLLEQALDLARNTTTIDPIEQANILERLAANQTRRGQILRANAYVNEALQLREKRFGRDSPEFAGALLRAADWYRQTGDFGRELKATREALAILEKHFEPNDARLTIPLIRIATARIGQRRNKNEAEEALQRAIALEFGPATEDAYQKAEVLATMADLRIVFGNAQAHTSMYSRA